MDTYDDPSNPLLSIRKEYRGKSQKQSRSAWIIYSLSASIIFTSCNLFMVELSKEGLYGYLFFCYGTLFASIMFFVHRMHMAKNRRGKFFKWSDLYIINPETGELKWGAIGGLASYSIIYQGGNILTILAFEYSELSGINQGIIISIYSMVPIWSAAIAYKVYHEKLQFNHYAGMTLLTICMGLISLSNVLDKSTTKLIPPDSATQLQLLKYHPVTPVFLALLATLLIAINMNIVKYYDKRGFPADVFAYSCYGVTNFIQALIAFVVFYYYGFNMSFFFFGFCGSFLNTVGLVCIALAVSSGLSGPSSALVNLQCIFQTLFQSYQWNQVPNLMQIFGLLCGVLGCLVITIHDYLMQIFCCCLRSNNTLNSETTDSEEEYQPYYQLMQGNEQNPTNRIPNSN